MTANPMTNQILATREEIRRVAGLLPKRMADDVDLFADRIAAALPDVKGAVVGEVLLHASDMYLTFATSNGRHGPTNEALVAVHMLGEAGERLYRDNNTTEEGS